jgi:hypothetical protein
MRLSPSIPRHILDTMELSIALRPRAILLALSTLWPPRAPRTRSQTLLMEGDAAMKKQRSRRGDLKVHEGGLTLVGRF